MSTQCDHLAPSWMQMKILAPQLSEVHFAENRHFLGEVFNLPLFSVMTYFKKLG